MAQDVDVLVVGAGLSGIGAGCHLEAVAPDATYRILEARERSGGTWDLFRYPGVRSDSDMFTLGYRRRPWRGEQSIASGAEILDYIRSTAAESGVEQHIEYGQRVVGASWSSGDARWTVEARDRSTGESTTRTCRFLYLCTGYYDYEAGHTPDWEGLADFGGELVHPQHWPHDIALAGKNVVVVGSGATAVTLVPALAAQGAHVTMLQRSPSYVLSLPSRDGLADLLRKALPGRAADAVIRWKNARTATAIYGLCKRYPQRARTLIRSATVKQLPADFDVDTHFKPAYQPWDQRMCLVPDGDFFRAIRQGDADVVTEHIDRFTPDGVRLDSGRVLPADVVVAATGLNLLPLAGLALTVDGEPVRVGDRLAYLGMMLEEVPNLAFAVGYTNASWTLKVDMVSDLVARIVAHLRSEGYDVVTPRPPVGDTARTPLIEMSSGYFERARASLPRQGDRAPWRLQEHYFRDAKLFRAPVEQSELEFRRVAKPAVPTP